MILTSNRTRELHEALRRRCVYHWIDYPDAQREADIVMIRASSVARETAEAVVRAVTSLRAEPLAKPPGIAETVEWAEAATLLHSQGDGWPSAFKRAIGVALKDQDDMAFVGDTDRHNCCRGCRMSNAAPLPRPLEPFVRFASVLRANGFAVAPDQTQDFIAAVGLLGPRGLSDVRNAAVALFAPPPERRGEFDALFRLVFLGQTLAAPVAQEPDDEDVEAYDAADLSREPVELEGEEEAGYEASTLEAPCNAATAWTRRRCGIGCSSAPGGAPSAVA